MHIRPAASFLSLDESMERVKEVNTIKELKDCINNHFGGVYFDLDTLQCTHYCKDNRIGWDTYLLTADYILDDKVVPQQAVAFADGPVDKLPLCILNGKPVYLPEHKPATEEV